MDSQNWNDFLKTNSSDSDGGFNIEEYFGNNFSCELNVEEDDFLFGFPSAVRNSSRVTEQSFENNLQVSDNNNGDQIVRTVPDLSTRLRTILSSDGQNQYPNPGPIIGSGSTQIQNSHSNPVDNGSNYSGQVYAPHLISHNKATYANVDSLSLSRLETQSVTQLNPDYLTENNEDRTISEGNHQPLPYHTSFGFRIPVERLPFLGPKDLVIKHNLLALAEACATLDQENVVRLYSVLKEDMIPTGSVVQKLAYYFVQGLIARSSGSGAEYCKAVAIPSGSVLNQIMETFLSKTPFFELSSISGIEEILDVCAGSTSLHVVDILCWTINWMDFLRQLALRFSSSFRLKVTFVLIQDPNVSQDDNETELYIFQLQNMAYSLGILAQFDLIRTEMRNLRLSEIKGKSQEETFVVNCGEILGQLPDKTVLNSSPRDRFMQMLYDVSPDLVLTDEYNFSLNSPFFLQRFKAVLDTSCVTLDLFSSLYSDPKELLLAERKLYAKDTINVIACEGLDRYVRYEDLESWRRKFAKVGFALKPVDRRVIQALERRVKNKYGSHFSVGNEDGGMHVCWKNYSIAVLCAWKLKML